MAYFPPTGSVVAFQNNPSVLQVLATVTNPVTFSSVSGTVGASVIGTVPVTQSGTIIVSVVGAMAGISSVYLVASSVTSVSVMSLNTNRKGGTIFNRSGTTNYIKLGTAATTSVYTVAMDDQDYYELPYGWTGVVAAISASTAGVLTVTEFT